MVQSLNEVALRAEARKCALSRARKPKPQPTTWHRDVAEPAPFRILHAAQRPDAMRQEAARTTSMVRDHPADLEIPPPHPPGSHPTHGHSWVKRMGHHAADAAHEFVFLHRSPCVGKVRERVAAWQSDYALQPNPAGGSWGHMEHRHQALGEREMGRREVCPECKCVSLETTHVNCFYCGAFHPSVGVDLPSIYDRQFSPRLHKAGVGGAEDGTARGEVAHPTDGFSPNVSQEELARRTDVPYHDTLVGLTKHDFDRIWKDGKVVVQKMHKAQAAARRADRRRRNSAFRAFDGGVPMPRDIGRQLSPRFRDGEDKLAQAQEIRERTDGKWGNPKAHSMRIKAATAPAAHKELGIAGPLDRFRHAR
jgi:hypothetical protein